MLGLSRSSHKSDLAMFSNSHRMRKVRGTWTWGRELLCFTCVFLGIILL